MKFLSQVLLSTVAFAMPALAQEVGIQFQDMEIGTTLVIEMRAAKPFRLSEKYVGERDGFYVTEVTRLSLDGTSKFSSTSFYDKKGRLVRRDRAKGFEAYEPYSCHYVIGECTHHYEYPNPFKDYEQTQNDQTYTTRLDGDTLIVSWKLIDGEIAEVPFKLGPYNLRVSSEYKNRLGQDSGHTFVELIVPSKAGLSAPDTTGLPRKSNVGQPASSDVNAQGCEALYAKLKAEAPGDVKICEPVISEPKTTECVKPSTYQAERAAAHVVMILDASGSMAAKLGADSKMDIAKKEAATFLAALEKDVPVGLLVYGHKGDNTEDGKAVSCAAVEWVQEVSLIPGRVAGKIKDLTPVGWTPLAASLDYLVDEIPKIRKQAGDETSVPVVYVLSDGEETCGGDPVASARTLHEAGAKAVVNVIGFDADEETRTQLEAISEAGGGKYFPAKDAKALREQLDAAARSEGELARYNYCASQNIGAVGVVYHNATVEMTSCFHRESKKKRLDVINSQVAQFQTTEEKACAGDVKRLAYQDFVEDGRWLSAATGRVGKERAIAMQEARERFGLLDTASDR